MNFFIYDRDSYKGIQPPPFLSSRASQSLRLRIQPAPATPLPAALAQQICSPLSSFRLATLAPEPPKPSALKFQRFDRQPLSDRAGADLFLSTPLAGADQVQPGGPRQLPPAGPGAQAAAAHGAEGEEAAVPGEGVAVDTGPWG